MDLQSQTSDINPQQKADTSQSSSKKKKILLILGIIAIGLLFILSIVGAYYFGQNSVKEPIQIATPTPIAENVNNIPQKVVFMREGEIWSKDLNTDIENKVSKSTKVGSPSLSPTGNHIYYFEIVHAGGGFPRYSMYLNNIEGSSEKKISKGANSYASKIKWSNDGNYLGLILFGNDIPGGVDYSEEAFIYDTASQNEIIIGKVNRTDLSDDQYEVVGSCDNLSEEYLEFCNEYVSYLNIPRENNSPTDYKREQFINSKYTKPNYNLTRSEKLPNGLVILEYYSGVPQNPESDGGPGGGVFVPGYDKGVTQTYTVLVNEVNDTAILEIFFAADTNFLFE